MTQNTTGRSEQSSLLASATKDELFVAQILLDLPYLVGMLESVTGPKWCGKKKRRSRMRKGASSSPAPSSPPPPSFRRSVVQVEERKPRPKTEEDVSAAAAASSPVTPLSFSSGESDEKSRRALKKNSKKRSREECDDMIEELTRHRDVLRLEIENVTNHYKKLNAYNSELKAMKQEVLNSCPKEQDPKVVIINRETESTQHHHHQISAVDHPQPFVSDQTAEKFQHSLGPITAQFYSACNGLGSVNNVGGPFKIPDLNISAEVAFGMDESQPLDSSVDLADRRARFAEARRRRRGIMKIKHMRSVCGIKLPDSR